MLAELLTPVLAFTGLTILELGLILLVIILLIRG